MNIVKLRLSFSQFQGLDNSWIVDPPLQVKINSTKD